MSSVKELWNEWEIHCLVLLSFTLQFFLFFTGSLRRRSTNKLLNFIIWIAYLGADLVAVYAVGFLSRNEDTTTGCDKLRGVHQLAFFWAPFLLIHLGGQDTITAFAIEDNNLWLRHLLNLIVQVTLAIYVFWKSIDQYSYGLIASGIFVSVTGIIKYGERTMALMYGSLRNMDGAHQKNKNTSSGSNIGALQKNKNRSSGSNFGALHQKNKNRSSGSNIGALQKNKNTSSGSNINEEDGSHITEDVEMAPRLEHVDDVDYLGIVSFALQSAAGVRELFAGHTLHQMQDGPRTVLTSAIHEDHMPKLLEVELDLMYNDLFTKAQVIRTKSGIVLRSLSQIFMVVAFVLFLVSDHHRYSRADLAITYLLFSGAFFLEASAVCLLLMSPWTWSWLKTRRYCRLAHVCATNLRQSERRTLWSNSMGQYNFLSYVGCEKSGLSKLVKRAARMTASLVGANEGKKPLLWLTKLLDTKHVKVDTAIMKSIIRTVYESHEAGPNSLLVDQDGRWPNIGPLLKHLLPDFGASLGHGIVCFHIFTEVYLDQFMKRDENDVTTILQDGDLVTACRQLSNYMLYLLVTRPEMLPVSGTTGPTIKFFLGDIAGEDWHRQTLSTQMIRAKDVLRGLGLSSKDEPVACRQTVQEMLSVWTRLLLYSAGKSRAALHAAGLSTGGELITFAWLLMAHNGLGDVGERYAFTIQDRQRIVLFPLPFQGHITPMLQLAALLHARGFAVTVLHTRFNAPDPTRYPDDFTFVPIDDDKWFPDEVTSPGADIVRHLLALNHACEAPFQKALISLLRRPGRDHFACVVVDGQCYSALYAAHHIGVPALALWTDSAGCMLAYPRLRDAALKRRDYLVPDLDPLQAPDLIGVNGCDTGELCNFIGRVVDAIQDSASGVIMNTFEGIEASELAKVLRELSCPAFTVGPLHLLELSLSQAPAEHSLHEPDRGCLAWLNEQPPSSVLYVSLGSMACVNRGAFVEMAWGLAVSGVAFLWVIRPGLDRGGKEFPRLPEGFIETIRDRGLIVSWAPQREVLAHTAIRGFWTHCGWNSTMESICEGVPMLVQPYFTDQMVNARYVTHEWGVGLEVGKEIERGRDGIAKAVTKFMWRPHEPQVRKVRERAHRLQRQILASAATSSGSAIDSLVKYIAEI